MHYNFTHATEGDVYGADQQRRARIPDSTWRACYSAPGSVERGSGELFSIYCTRMPYRVCRMPYICVYICYCPCCMFACGATYSRLCGAHRRFSQHTPTRDAKPARLHRGALSCCTYTYTIRLWCCCPCACACAGCHSLAAPRGLQPEITALARRGRKSFDSPLAMMHTRRSSAHVSLTAFFGANPALTICGQLLRVARVAALREGHLRWEHCRALFVAFLGLDIPASIFSAAWTCVAAP